jgi:hypothetical protein
MRIPSDLFLVAALGAWALPARAGPTKLGREMKTPDDEVRRLAAEQRRDFTPLPNAYSGQLETFDRFVFKVEQGQCYAVAMQLDRKDYAVDACTRNGPSATLKEPGVRRPKPIEFHGFEQNAFTSCPAKTSGNAFLTLRFACKRKTTGKGSLRLQLYGRSLSAHPSTAKAIAKANLVKEQSMISACESCKDKLQQCHDQGTPSVKCDADFATCASAITIGGHNLRASDCE